MRTYLAMPVVCAVLLAAITTGGCVSKQQYDEAMAANRRIRGTLNKSIAVQSELRADNQQLTEELAAKERLMAAKNQKLTVLQAAHDDLKKNFDTLHKAYETLKGRPQTVIMRELPEQVDKALTQFAKDHPQLVEYLPKYGMVKFKADLTFALGSDEVQAGALEALGAFARVVNSPEAAKFHIYVAGHTDDVPIRKAETRRRHPNNWYLSVHRAVAVEEALAKGGVSPKRLGAMGFGEYHPIAPNRPGNKGNVVNRRVEIWIISSDRFLTITGGAGGGAAPAATK